MCKPNTKYIESDWRKCSTLDMDAFKRVLNYSLISQWFKEQTSTKLFSDKAMIRRTNEYLTILWLASDSKNKRVLNYSLIRQWFKEQTSTKLLSDKPMIKRTNE